MAKNESTAVNELIATMQGAKPAPDKAPGDDLFGTKRVAPPRMSATIPPMRGAGDIAPLPRSRAPGSTAQHKLPNQPPPVRATTAPPTRGHTIPPIPAPASVRTSAPIPVTPTRPTRPSVPPPATPPVCARATMPPTPAPARPSVRPSVPPPQRPTPSADPGNPLVAAPISQRAITIDRPGDVVSADPWFEASRAVDKANIDALISTGGTMAIPRVRPRGELAKKLIAPAAALAVVGVMVGGYFAFNGEGGKKHHAATAATAKLAPGVTAPTPAAAELPAPTPPTPEPANAATATAGAAQPEPPPPPPAAAAAVPVPAPAPAPVPAAVPAPAPAAAATVAATPDPTTVREVQTTRGVVKLVDVRVDSKPAGATVMLVDNGKTSFLGTTPLATSVDPSRAYDVIFTLEGRPTQMAHLDPYKTHHLDVPLGKYVAKSPAPVEKAAPAEKPAPVEKASPAERPAPVAKAAATGTGTLMVSSKPPCEIIVDGKTTGLLTPQRALKLSAGPHQITLVTAENDKKKTFPVTITANQPTKLIENLMP